MSASPRLPISLRLAWRNLWRNSRRTALALAAISLSVMLVLAYDAILRSYSVWLLEAVTGPMLGHVQVHARDWRTDRALDLTVPHAGATIAALRRDAGVADVTGRVYAPVLVARDTDGVTAVAIGLDLDAESRPQRLLDGSPLAALGPHDALVGVALAERAGIRAGDVMALVGQAADGSIANDLVTVRGVVTTSVDLVNQQGVLLPLPAAQELFAVPDAVHELVLHVRAPESAAAVAARLRQLPALRDLEVLDWKSVAPELVTLLRIVDVAWLFVLGLVMVAAAAGIANTMLMATFERTRELGMLLALGTPPSRVVRMVVTESVVLGLLGTTTGSLAALTLVLIAQRTGFDYAALAGGGPSELSFAGLRWSLVLYPQLALEDFLRVFAAVGGTTVLACLWPALRAARLQPASAMRS